MKISIWLILIIGAMKIFDIFTTLDISRRSITRERSALKKFCAEQNTHIYSCDYNLLTLNQEYEMRALLNYCGLKWHLRVLKFEESTRVIKTTSVSQVREGIYRTSIGFWKKYKNFLDPMYNTLKDKKAFEP